jgi:pyrroloquinoline quinone biosynthesis protein B
MRVKILGSAAGGGFPQWNCACTNCRRVRDGSFPGSPRTQTQLAWSPTPGQWSLLNASPDLRVQIESRSELWPRDGGRESPIRDVVLPSAELDQVLGLLLLREFHSFRVHATPSVRKILTEDNSLFGVLARFPGQVCWQDILLDQPFSVGGARLEALPLPGSFPGFVSASRQAELNPHDAVIGLLISPDSPANSRADSSERTLAFLPGVAYVSDTLLATMQNCDILLFDGTFWSDDEPLRIPGITRTARQMGHLPLSGSGGSLERFAGLRRPRKILIHINNTNPILDEESREYRTVHEAGWEVAHDGMELTL